MNSEQPEEEDVLLDGPPQTSETSRTSSVVLPASLPWFFPSFFIPFIHSIPPSFLLFSTLIFLLTSFLPSYLLHSFPSHFFILSPSPSFFIIFLLCSFFLSPFFPFPPSFLLVFFLSVPLITSFLPSILASIFPSLLLSFHPGFHPSFFSFSFPPSSK